MNRDDLINLYYNQKLSAQQIAAGLGYSVNKVNYWLKKYNIERRTRSDASYIRHNPGGDPFSLPDLSQRDLAILHALGMGLYWGEGNKANKTSVRLGNSDPGVIKIFIKFLVDCYSVDKQRLRFGLQLFSDCDQQKALAYWVRYLGVEVSQFYRITVTISGSIGTYRHKNKYGVVTVYFNNKKLRDVLVARIADIAQG